MSLSKLILFDRPLRGATAVIRAATQEYTAAEIDEIREKARQEGAEQTRSFADQQMVEMRSEVAELSSGLLENLRQADARLAEQVRAALPGLAVEIGRRLLAGWEPPPELVDKICREALDELFPETTGLELVVCERDAALLEQARPGWVNEFPGLKITVDAALHPGDCLVRSRFGVVDARAATRLRALEESLAHA